MVHALIFTLKYGHTSSSLMLSLFGPSIFQVGTWFVIFLDSIQYHNDFVFTLISFSFYEICNNFPHHFKVFRSQTPRFFLTLFTFNMRLQKQQ